MPAGQLSATQILSGAATEFGVDWDADGSPDWASTVGSAPGHSWLFVTPAPVGKPLLMVLNDGGYPFIGGSLLK